jgi:hypothetical protein
MYRSLSSLLPADRPCARSAGWPDNKEDVMEIPVFAWNKNTLFINISQFFMMMRLCMVPFFSFHCPYEPLKLYTPPVFEWRGKVWKKEYDKFLTHLSREPKYVPRDHSLL